MSILWDTAGRIVKLQMVIKLSSHQYIRGDLMLVESMIRDTKIQD